jgi:hypothetical protein
VLGPEFSEQEQRAAARREMTRERDTRSQPEMSREPVTTR